MRSCSADLEGRTASVLLTEWGGVSEPVWEPLLAPTHAHRGAWRVVDLFSEDARRPWRAELRWGAGGAQGQLALISIARATRVCVFASSLTVRAQNWSTSKHHVSVAVADGFDPSRNQLEYQDAVDAGFPVELDIPPFADRLHVEVADRTLAGTTEIRQFDAAGTEFGRCLVSDIYGGPGLPCGHLAYVQIVSSGATAFRAIFTLRL